MRNIRRGLPAARVGDGRQSHSVTIGDSVTKGKLDGDDLTLYLYDGVTTRVEKIGVALLT